MKKFLVLPALLALSACGINAVDGVASRGENKGGMFGMTANAPVSTEGSVADIQNVVIGSFKVGFAESSKETSKARGTVLGGAVSGGNSTGKVKLEGVSDALKQDITEAAYADFLSKLKASGYNVVERSTLTSSSQYQAASKKNFPYLLDQSGMLSSYGQTKYYQPKSFGSEGIILMVDMPSAAKGFAAMGAPDMKMADFAQAKNTAVVSATYLVDFAVAEGSASITTSSMKVGQNLAVTEGAIRFVKGGTSTFNNGTPSLVLGQPIESGQEFGTITDATSGGMKAAEEAANVFSMVLGGGTNRSRSFNIQADPAKYKAQSLAILAKTNASLLAQPKK